MIDGRDISVVVQGPTTSTIATVVRSVRNHFPRSEIILSTWQGSDTSSLDADIVLRNDDPGALTYGDPPLVDNVNRQIVSTSAGLRAASRPLAIKLRSDCRVLDSRLLSLFDRYPERSKTNRIFSKRIICCTQFCRDPRRSPFLFHPGDVFQFGLREDLLKAWDVPLRKPPARDRKLTKTFELRPYLATNLPLVPEQYIWLQVLAAAGRDVQLDHAGDWSFSLARQSDRLFVDNFVPYSAEDLGIELPPHLNDAARTPSATYSHDRWTALYRSYYHGGARFRTNARLLLSSGYVFFGFAAQPFWTRLRILAGALRRQIRYSIGLGRAEHS